MPRVINHWVHVPECDSSHSVCLSVCYHIFGDIVLLVASQLLLCIDVIAAVGPAGPEFCIHG